MRKICLPGAKLWDRRIHWHWPSPEEHSAVWHELYKATSCLCRQFWYHRNCSLYKKKNLHLRIVVGYCTIHTCYKKNNITLEIQSWGFIHVSEMCKNSMFKCILSTDKIDLLIIFIQVNVLWRSLSYRTILHAKPALKFTIYLCCSHRLIKSISVSHYTPWVKKHTGHPILLPITLPNVDRFSFFSPCDSDVNV